MKWKTETNEVEYELQLHHHPSKWYSTSIPKQTKKGGENREVWMIL